MVQGPCAHLQRHETSSVVRDRLNVIIDRLNVISSGTGVVVKIDAKVCFQGDHLAAVIEGRNVAVPINTMLEYSRSNSGILNFDLCDLQKYVKSKTWL
jgi:hypothetical protein